MVDFGLGLAETRPLSFLGPLSLAIRDAGTLREALDTASRYLPLHRDGVVLSLEKMDDAAIYKMVVLASRSSHPRQSVEAGVGVWHRIIRQLLGGAQRTHTVWFSHSAPADMTAHQRMFGPGVEFGRDCTGILLETRDLDAPLPAADLLMAQHVQQYLEPMLAQINVTLSEKTRQLVYDLLPSGRCSVEQLAARLDMNPRTLHRYLARAGDTCWSIVDDVRVSLARRFVEDDGLSFGDISDSLGFSNRSAFSRWFRTSFASSPTEWRDLHSPRARGGASGSA